MTTKSINKSSLPVGQQARSDFPRFGVSRFATYEPTVSTDYHFMVDGDIPTFEISSNDLSKLERVELVSDFHCVTTWSYQGIKWSGFRFKDVYEAFIQPCIPAQMKIKLLAFRAHDKYKSSLLIEDALADDVFLVDTLNDEPLSAKHGAPVRLLAPAHYGYKNVKHLRKIEVWQNTSAYKPLIPRIMEHPRARVAFEERGRYFPGWLFRYLYRPLIDSTVRKLNAD